MSEKLKSFAAIVSCVHFFIFPFCVRVQLRDAENMEHIDSMTCTTCVFCARNSTNNNNKWMSYNAVVLVSIVWQQTNDFAGMPIEWKSDTCRVLNHIDMTVFGRSTNRRSPNANIWESHVVQWGKLHDHFLCHYTPMTMRRRSTWAVLPHAHSW